MTRAVRIERGHVEQDESMNDLDAALDRFVQRLRSRLAAGAQRYGDVSFRRPAADLLDEVQQEIEDTFGWTLLAWLRIARLRKRVDAIEEGGPDGAS